MVGVIVQGSADPGNLVVDLRLADSICFQCGIGFTWRVLPYFGYRSNVLLRKWHGLPVGAQRF